MLGVSVCNCRLLLHRSVFSMVILTFSCPVLPLQKISSLLPTVTIHHIVGQSKEVWEIGKVIDSLNKLCASLVCSLPLPPLPKVPGSAVPECLYFFVEKEFSLHCWLKF